MEKKFFILIVCLILLIFIFSFNSTTGKFVLQTSNKLTVLIISSILLFLIFASIRVLKVEEDEKYLPPGIHIEIPSYVRKYFTNFNLIKFHIPNHTIF
jgi:hypothetical protein